MNAASAILSGTNVPPPMGWRQAAAAATPDTDAAAASLATSATSGLATTGPALPAAGAARPANEAASVAPAAGETGLDSPMGRYPSLAFAYNQSAGRLVMLYRSPATGETESQIPSEVALRMYETVARPPRRVAATGPETAGDPGAPAVPDSSPTPSSSLDIVVSGSGTSGSFDSFSGGQRGAGFGPPPTTLSAAGSGGAPASPVAPTSTGLASTGLASTGLASTGLASTGLASTGLAAAGLASAGPVPSAPAGGAPSTGGNRVDMTV